MQRVHELVSLWQAAAGRDRTSFRRAAGTGVQRLAGNTNALVGAPAVHHVNRTVNRKFLVTVRNRALGLARPDSADKVNVGGGRRLE
jgi:hypothetical protein